MRVVHVINCLSLGGAERQLLRLAAEQRRDGDAVTIVTLLDKDTLRPDADAAGVPVRAIGVRSALGFPRAVLRLRGWLRELEPQVVQSWLYYANLVALAAKPKVLVWNIRQTLPDLAGERLLMRRAIRLGARWSGLPHGIVCNAREGLEQHRAIGYANAIEEIIPNGFDVERFGHGNEATRTARATLDLPADAVVVAHAARRHPMKDHAGFLEAIAPLLERRRELVVVMMGREVDETHLSADLARHAALSRALAERRLRLLGERLDLESLYPAFDLVVSSSAWGEAFPNVLAEAMASGVGVVATDVGESRALVEDPARVVPPSRPDLLRAAIDAWLDRSESRRRADAELGRGRIAERYSIRAVLERYRSLWRRAIEAR